MPSSFELVLDAIQRGDSADAHESETLEFKADHADGAKATLRSLAEAAICFANCRGGRTVLGIRDQPGGPEAFVGTDLDPDAVRHAIWRLTEPSLLVSVDRVDFRGCRLLVIDVPESPEIHADSQGRAFRRMHKSCHSLTPSQQARLREDKQSVDWSALPSERSPREVSSHAVSLARDLLKRHWDPERARLSRLRDHDLLRQLGALRQDGQLSNCGEIMFCDSTGPAERIVYVYRRTPGGEPTEHRRLSGPLLVAYDEAMRSVEARRRLTPVSLPRGQQIHIEDFPNRAVREVLSNAVIHRDYQSPAPVHVAHSPQVFEVTSPGPLVAGVTPDNILTHESKPRNPALARTARLLGLAEEVGTGIDRVFKEMLLSGKGIPTIESDPSRVRVTLTGGGPNVRVPLYVDQLPEEEREDVDTLLVLFALCHSRTVDAVGMATLLQKPPASAQAVLQRLSQDSVGMLEATRGTARRASPRYRLRSQAVASLGTAVRYNRRLPDDVDRKVIAHVREYEKITNRTVRNLLDVDVYRAAEILSDLVGREVLVRTTEATRGPSVEYGPGLRFPTSGGASDATPTRRWRRGRPGGSA